MAAHRSCVCGDVQPCSCTPSQGWHAPDWWPATHGDWRLVVNAIEASERALSRKFDRVLKEIRSMSVSVDKLNADIQTLVAGYQAVVAERDALKAALASADATQAQAVADAVAAEDADAQSKIDAADAVVAGVNNPAPADSGDGSAPADGSAPDAPPAEPVDGATS
jgi:hypothetical protein